MEIYNSIKTLKGVGEKTGEQLEKIGIRNILDLILYFPRAYEKYFEADETLFNGLDKIKIKATVLKTTRPFRTKTGKTLSSVYFSTDFGQLKAMYFNMPFITGNFKVGETYELLGKFTKNGKNIEGINPSINKDTEEIVPVYPLGERVTNHLLKKESLQHQQ